MNTEDRVQKLEGLLARVKARAAEPRVPAAPPSAADTTPALVESAPVSASRAPALVSTVTPAVPFVVPPHLATPRRVVPASEETQRFYGSPRDIDAPFSEDETRKESFAKPAAKAPTAPPPPTSYTQQEVAVAESLASAEADGDVDVETSADEVEVEIDVDEAGLDDEELAAAEADAAAQLAAAGEPAELAVVHDDDDGDQELTAAGQRLANEVEEPEPSSSPRPIVEAHEPEPARHTPPPESGKQVAASAPPRAPSDLPPAGREPSMPPLSEPPDSLGGHTLIGGWREPGLGPGGPGGPGMGVRVPAALANVPSPISVPPAPLTAAQGAMPSQPFIGSSVGPSTDFTGPKPARSAVAAPPPVQAKAPIRPETTEPDLGARADVARFEGQAPAFAPASFGELLDATLGL